MLPQSVINDLCQYRHSPRTVLPAHDTMIPALQRLQFGPMLDVAAQSCAAANPSVRLENQDNYLLIDIHGQAVFLRGEVEQRQRVDGWPSGHARIAVLDGMGGHGRGREAAEAVVAGLLAMPACASLGQLSALLEELHARLQRHFADSADAANPDKRPGTTLTMLELRPGQAALLWHVGDSRLYEIARGQAVPMTVDHVPATAFAMGGLLGEHEWWQQVHCEHRSQISQAFILGNAFDKPSALSAPLHELSPRNLPPFLYHLPDRRAIELDPGALYVLATDGFWACDAPQAWLGSWTRLLAGEHSAHAMCDALFTGMLAAPPPGLHMDNITAIVLRPLRKAHGDDRAQDISTRQLNRGNGEKDC